MTEQTVQHDDNLDLTEENLKEIDECFAMLDTNKNGFIEYGELQPLFALLGQNPRESTLKQIIENAEKYSDRKDGKLDKDEFIQLMKEEYGRMRTKEEEEEEILDAFRVFDRNGDGFITYDELVKVLSCQGDISDEEAREMMKEVDTDNDGRISYQEFVAKMMSA